MDAIGRLENIGYQFTIEGDKILYTLAPGREVDPVIVKPLLDELRQRKQEALDYLRRPPADADLLTTGTPDECNVLGAALREAIRRRGYCLVRSAVLNSEVIAVVDCDNHRHLAPQGYVTYTLAELTLLAEGHRRGDIVTIGDLMLLHAAKKRLGGVIEQ